MKKILIDIERVLPDDETGVILLHQTGIFYDAQVGGVSCMHPEKEGFVLRMGNFGAGFDACAYGCAYIQQDKNIQMKIGADFQKLCDEYFEDMILRLDFDFERVEETMEGWIPIVFRGELSYKNNGHFKGYFYNGNCD